jgi:hypothetical protein
MTCRPLKEAQASTRHQKSVRRFVNQELNISNRWISLFTRWWIKAAG